MSSVRTYRGGRWISSTGILFIALAATVRCAPDNTITPVDPTVALAEMPSSKGWWHWKQTLSIDPDSTTLSEPGDTVRLFAILSTESKRNESPTLVEADWFVLDPDIVQVEGSTTSTRSVLLRGVQPGMARIVTIYDGLAAIASVWVEEGDPGDPVPVAAVVSDVQPVLLEGDTVTVRPNLIDEDSVVIATEPSEWSADFDSDFVSVSEEFLVTALAPTPPGSTTVIVLTHTDTELAAEVAVTVLPDGDPGVPVAAVVSEPQPVLLVGDTLTVRPNLIDEDGMVIPTEPSEWSSDFDPAVVTVSENFLVTALAPTPPGSTTDAVFTHVETAIAVDAEIVILPESDPGEWPDNEPAGMTPILMVDGSSKDWPGFRQGTKWRDDSRVTVVNDPESKHGQAIEKRFFVGDESGWQGITWDGNVPSEELYFRIVFRLSANWQWHKAGGKYFYYGAVDLNHTPFVLGWHADGRPFWSASGDGRFIPNSVTASTRGVYHTIEIHHVASTSGANGSLRMWVDGIEVETFDRLGDPTQNEVQLVNQEWSATRNLADKRLARLQAFMYWGGQGDTKRVDDWVRLSELYISGKK